MVAALRLGPVVDVSRDGGRHVGVDGEQPGWGLQAHLVDDERPPITALGDVAGVTEARHQFRPGAADALGAPASLGRLGGEPVPRHRGDHHMEGVHGARAVRRGIGERLDDLQLLDDRAGPPVIHDERQRLLMRRSNVDEVDVQTVDLGHELRQGVQPCLAPAPVVLRRPVARQLLRHRERDALRLIGDGLLLRPARVHDAPAQVDERCFRNVDVEGTDLDGGLDGAAHDVLPVRLCVVALPPSLIRSPARRTGRRPWSR